MWRTYSRIKAWYSRFAVDCFLRLAIISSIYCISYNFRPNLNLRNFETALHNLDITISRLKLANTYLNPNHKHKRYEASPPSRPRMLDTPHTPLSAPDVFMRNAFLKTAQFRGTYILYHTQAYAANEPRKKLSLLLLRKLSQANF